MAKKKKFNRRILVLLPIVVLVVAALGIGIVLMRLPGDPQKTFAKAQAAFDIGDYREARRLADKAVADITKSEPDSPQVAEYLYKAALLNLRIATDGKPPITQQERGEAGGAAIGLFKKTVLRDPKHADAQKKICDLTRDPMEFIAQSEKYLKLRPDDDEMIFRHAKANVIVYIRMGGGDCDKVALEDFKRLLELKPDNLEYWRGEAGLLWEKKNHDGALAVMLEAVTKNPRSADFCVAYADFLRNDEFLKQTKPKKVKDPATGKEVTEKLASEIWYEEAIRRQPENIVGYLTLARVRASGQHYKEAIALLETAAQKDPCDYRVYDQAATAYEQSDDRNNAVKILKMGLSTINDQLSKGSGSPQSAPAAASAPSTAAKASTDKSRMEDGQFALTARLAIEILGLAGSPDQSENRQALLKEASALGADLNKYRTNCPEYSKVMGGVALTTAAASSAGARRDNYEKAANLLEEATTRFDQTYRGGFDIQTASWLANSYLALGRTGDAQKVLENIRKVDQKDIWPLMDLIRLSINNGDFNRAKEFVATVLSVEPTNEQAISLLNAFRIADANVLPAKLPDIMKFSEPVLRVLFQKARTFDSEQQHREAVQLLSLMWDKDPHNPIIFVELLNRLLSAHEMTQAKEKLELAKKRFADMPAVMNDLQKNEEMIFAPTEAERYKLRLATADKETDAFAKALSKSAVELDYSNALSANDNEKQVHAEAGLKYLNEALALQPDSQDVLGRLLQYYMAAGKWNEGQTVVDKLVSLNADGVNGKFVKGQFLLNKGEAGGTKADVEAAVGLFKEGLKEKATLANAWGLLGEAYLSLGQYADAEDAYDHSLKIDGNVSATIGMAKVKLTLLKMDEYEELIKKAYPKALGNAWVRGRYLDIIASTANPVDLARLIKMCEQNHQNAPNDVENTMRLARLYEKAKQVSNAEKLYVELYKGSANKLAAAEVLASFYVRNKKQSDADTLVGDLVKDPKVDKAGAYMLWGRVLATMPQGAEQAEAAFTKAIELKPDDLQTQLALATFYAQLPNHMKQAADVLGAYVAAQKNPPAKPEIRRQLCAYLLDSGQYDQAGKLISAMLADPADFEARELNGLMFLRQNNPGEAIEQFNQALAINASHSVSLRLRGIAQLQKGDKRKALEDLGRAADISKDPNTEMLVVDVSASLKNYDNAEKVLGVMLASRPDDMQAVQKLAGVYLAQTKDQGWGRLEKLIAAGKISHPGEPTYYQIEAQMWDLRKQTGKQIEALKKLLTMPEPMVVAGALESYLRVLQSTGQYDKMADLIEQYIQKSDFGWLKAYQGYVAIKHKNTAEAEKYFSEVVRGASHSQVAAVLAEIAQAYSVKDAPDKSRQWVKERGDNDCLAWWQLAVEYARVPNIPLAQEAYQIALKNSAGAEKANIGRSAGRVFYDLGVAETGPKRADLLAISEKAYLESLSVAPDNNDALNNLAYLYVEYLNQPDKAFPYAQRAYILSPGVANVADTYGWVLAKLKRYDKAIDVLEQVIEVPEGNPAFRYHLGWVYEQTGQRDKARGQYESALTATTDDKAPLYDLLKKAIERVKK